MCPEHLQQNLENSAAQNILYVLLDIVDQLQKTTCYISH